LDVPASSFSSPDTPSTSQTSQNGRVAARHFRLFRQHRPVHLLVHRAVLHPRQDGRGAGRRLPALRPGALRAAAQHLRTHQHPRQSPREQGHRRQPDRRSADDLLLRHLLPGPGRQRDGRLHSVGRGAVDCPLIDLRGASPSSLPLSLSLFISIPKKKTNPTLHDFVSQRHEPFLILHTGY
jgi:hypothetical protein